MGNATSRAALRKASLRSVPDKAPRLIHASRAVIGGAAFFPHIPPTVAPRTHGDGAPRQKG